jgi:hypothetical protein
LGEVKSASCIQLHHAVHLEPHRTSTVTFRLDEDFQFSTGKIYHTSEAIFSDRPAHDSKKNLVPFSEMMVGMKGVAHFVPIQNEIAKINIHYPDIGNRFPGLGAISFAQRDDTQLIPSDFSAIWSHENY